MRSPKEESGAGKQVDDRRVLRATLMSAARDRNDWLNTIDEDSSRSCLLRRVSNRNGRSSLSIWKYAARNAYDSIGSFRESLLVVIVSCGSLADGDGLHGFARG